MPAHVYHSGRSMLIARNTAIGLLPTSLSRLVLVFCLLLVMPISQAEIRLDDHTPAQNLNDLADYLADPSGTLTLADIQQVDADFSHRQNLSFGYTRGPVWLRLQLRSHTLQARTWRVELDYPSLDEVRLYDVGSDGIRTSRSGDTVPYSERDVRIPDRKSTR